MVRGCNPFCPSTSVRKNKGSSMRRYEKTISFSLPVFPNKKIVLDIMATHPFHQKRGAGTMTVKWGTDLADSLGMKCFIEASPPGKRLYEKCGFVAVPEEYIHVSVPEKWNGRPAIGFYFYERLPAGQTPSREVKEN